MLNMIQGKRIGAGMEWRGGSEVREYHVFVGSRDWEARYRWVDPDTGIPGHWETLGAWRDSSRAIKACQDKEASLAPLA